MVFQERLRDLGPWFVVPYGLFQAVQPLLVGFPRLQRLARLRRVEALRPPRRVHDGRCPGARQRGRGAAGKAGPAGRGDVPDPLRAERKATGECGEGWMVGWMVGWMDGWEGG